MATRDSSEEGQDTLISSNGFDEIDKDQVVENLEDFALFLTLFIEQNFEVLLGILTEKTSSENSNSYVIKALGALATALPAFGECINTGLKETEIFFLNKINKQNASKVAHLIFYFSRNREQIRNMLIETAMEIFYCFEPQFMKLKCNGTRTRAMIKVAHDAAHRIYTYFLNNKQIDSMSKQHLIEGVMKGEPFKCKKSGRTVYAMTEEWNTANIYRKVGIFLDEENERKYFKNKNTNTKKYGHRRLFSWEDPRKMEEEWSEDEVPSLEPCYYLEKSDFKHLFERIQEYIISQKPEEEARHDRQQKHKASLDDRAFKHEELKKMIIAQEGIFRDLSQIYLAVKTTEELNRKVLATIEGNQAVDEERHQELSQKLWDLQQTNYQVLQTSENIRQEIVELKMSSQYEISSTTENQVTINAVIQNNVTINQYCNHERPRTLPELLEDVSNKPKVKKFSEALDEIADNVQEKLDEMKERKGRSPMAEAMKEISENVQEKLEEMKTSNRELSKAINTTISRLTSAEMKEVRRKKVQNFFRMK